MLKLLRNGTLPIAMLLGIAAHRYMVNLSFLLPFLIFTMIFLSFSKISFRELKAGPLHLWLLLFQAATAFAAYGALAFFDKIAAGSVMLCLIAPTASSAAVITQRLGGNVASVTVYMVISNLFAALLIPIVLPLIEPGADLPFAAVSLVILKKLFLLLVLPFFLAQILSRFFPALHGKVVKYSGVSFYLGACGLTIVTAVTYYAVMSAEAARFTELLMVFAALAVCVLQFTAGKLIGGRYNERISGGQAIGQKNTVLAIWLSVTYLNPVSVIGPGSYILWQTIINSYQLWKKRNL
ncbi:MAG: bile acid:sodium symporter [Leptospirales bacterium]|nr:bile acid:sodium symporter [Leptospirales bacterium]